MLERIARYWEPLAKSFLQTLIGNDNEIKAMLTRLMDYLRNQGATTDYTSLTGGESAAEQSEAGISSLMDTWLLVK